MKFITSKYNKTNFVKILSALEPSKMSFIFDKNISDMSNFSDKDKNYNGHDKDKGGASKMLNVVGGGLGRENEDEHVVMPNANEHAK
jgi:hypothetical protein